MGAATDVEQLTALVDGDTLAFIAAAACQHTLEESDGWVMPFANVAEGEACLDNLILGLQRDLGAHYVQVYLSDPSQHYWRHDLFPAYKGDRKATARPMLLARLKEYLRGTYGATHLPGLEADDVLGILATAPPTYPGKRVIAGRDKDFRTVPCNYYELGNRRSDGRAKVEEINEETADFFHLVQTLSGDHIDGYPGCPGIGVSQDYKRAREILSDPKVLRPERGTITRGPRKGHETTRWVAEPANGDLWAAVVSQYEKQGLGEKDALLTARLAHILRWEDYDMDTGKITLWVPPDRIRRRKGEKA